jgi:hypothetical protein
MNINGLKDFYIYDKLLGGLSDVIEATSIEDAQLQFDSYNKERFSLVPAEAEELLTVWGLK